MAVRCGWTVRIALVAATVGAASMVVWGGAVLAADSDALWKIVHRKCAVTVAPCLLVDEHDHFALLKDLRGVAQILLIPTVKITGVEDPELQKPETPNYFADAWEHRSMMLAKLPRPLPRDSISLVVNAETARTQNQLHIHIDCLSTEARDALKAVAPGVGGAWAPIGTTIVGHNFMARRVMESDFAAFNPFSEVAVKLGTPAKDMYRRNIVVAGADFTDGPGFLVLTDEAPTVPLGFGGGEDVQDHDCAIAR